MLSTVGLEERKDSRLAQTKFLSAEGLRAARSTNCRTHPFAEAEEQGPASPKEWGTHFLVRDTKPKAWATRRALHRMPNRIRDYPRSSLIALPNPSVVKSFPRH